jgi:hypothetical protein
VLEQNLGNGFLSALHKKDKIAGRSNAWDFVQDDPKLPRVLLIGDSISRGYTQDVRKAMAGKANVHRAPENCGPTANGVKKIEIWLGDGQWDVIHFNFGIHDRKTPAADYEQRLETLITRMKQTGAKLIFATTTPVPPDTKDGPELVTQIAEKNEIALRVMKKHGVAIDDLYGFLAPQLEGIANPQDVHLQRQRLRTHGPAGGEVDSRTTPIAMKLRLAGFDCFPAAGHSRAGCEAEELGRRHSAGHQRRQDDRSASFSAETGKGGHL